MDLDTFPIRCTWGAGPGFGLGGCGRPAARLVTSGCPHGTSTHPSFDAWTCADHLATFEERHARTGWHFLPVCCGGAHGRVLLATRLPNEGDLPDPQRTRPGS